MKVIITKDIEIRGRDETPRLNCSMSLKKNDKPQTLPSWVVKQAIRRGAGKEVKKGE